LGTEHDNLRVALGWTLTHPGRAEDALRLVAALQWFWFIRGPAAEGRQWLERAVSIGLEAPAGPRARALAGLGMLAWRAGDFAEARSALEEGLTLAKTVG